MESKMATVHIIERATRKDLTEEVLTKRLKLVSNKYGDWRVVKDGKDITDSIYFGIEQ